MYKLYIYIYIYIYEFFIDYVKGLYFFSLYKVANVIFHLVLPFKVIIKTFEFSRCIIREELLFASWHINRTSYEIISTHIMDV